jgi:hypothetical protein
MSTLQRVIVVSGSGLSTCLLTLSKVLYVVCGLTFFGFVGTGLWELTVWLFQTDWRNSGFEVPAILLLLSLLIGFGAYFSYLLGRGFRASVREEVRLDSVSYFLMVAIAAILILTICWIIL